MLKGLGKGLESLIPTDIVEADFDLTASEDNSISKLTEVKLDEIVPDDTQPRQNFDPAALEALASSIREHGVLQPIVVTREESDVATTPHYKIVAGERRWRAAKLAGLTTIPAIIRTIDAQNRLELSIIENAQREDLNPIELATAYAKLKSQFNLSTKDIAARIGKSDTSVVNTMRLLNLPEEAKHAMVEHNLSEGVMRPLVSADPELIHKILPRIIEEGWSARRVERYIKLAKPKSSAVAVKSNHFARHEENLSNKYHADVRISSRSVTFSCKNEEELKKLLDKLT